jgi:Fe-S cluster assembly protein SufD
MSDQIKVISSTRRREEKREEWLLSENDIRKVNQPRIDEYRTAAWKAFNNLGMPQRTEEAWRRTDIRGLAFSRFILPEAGLYQNLEQPPKELLESVTGESHGGQILLLPGGAQSTLDHDIKEQGVVFCDLQKAELEHPEILGKVIGSVIGASEGKFAALSGAFAQNGVLLYVPRNVVVEKPLHSLMWGPGLNLAYVSHILVFLEDGAQVTYVHEAASPSYADGQTMHSGLFEVHVGRGANLRLVELQSWGEHIWNFSHERVEVEADGNLDWIFGAVGSHLTKNFSDLNLIGRGSTGRMSGFFFSDHQQHLDHDTQQNHLAAHTTSDLLFKGALLGHSRSVWQGMIYVSPEGTKTDGYQANRNLVLSPNARADSIPGLEIKTDDVRCTHGATVGQIDPEPVFYLMSRGISRRDAERLIVEGFFDPIMQRIPFEGVRQRFQLAIQEKMQSFGI